jgi:hypothetical protein
MVLFEEEKDEKIVKENIEENKEEKKDEKKGIFQLIKESSTYTSKNAKYCKINYENLKKFAENIDYEKLQNFTKSTKLPLIFDDLSHEINFYCYYSVLNFGSGYRKPLHKYCNRGAAETILYGCISLILGGEKLDAFTNFTLMDIEKNFNIPISMEVEVYN